MTVNERIAAIRKLMADKNIDVYYIPNEDDHLSEEYTADHFKCKSFVSGFSGESGCVVITKDFCGLWTDGRYFTQAENELAGSDVELMRMGQEGVPAVMDFLIEKTPENGTLGFDGNVVSTAKSFELLRRLKPKQAKLHVSDDLTGMIWSDRPAMPGQPVYTLDEQYTGASAARRIAMVREKMQEKGADVLVITRLEDPCWLFNLRGNDIESTPVAYAFAMLDGEDVYYYIDSVQVDEAVCAYLKDNGVTVRGYDDLAEDLSRLHDKNIWVNPQSFNSRLYSCLAKDNRLISEEGPIAMFRAVKNETEIANTKHAHLKDGATVVRFIKYVKEHVKDGNMTEVSAQNELYRLREEQPDYIEPSFATISAYQANGAMMHYTATDENHAKVEPRGFLLVDSGGTYKDGTTDITRTIAVGPLTEEEKMLYTLVLKGHLNLISAKFLKGTTGQNLDILARGPLWKIGIDYQCGTGHGVGHVLSVHEGPHCIRWGMGTPAKPACPLAAGMIVTDEPGVYMPHKLGIRIENELLVTEAEKNFYGQFLQFENLTYAPYEPEAIDLRYLTDEELAQLNSYHEEVIRKLTPYLDEEELAWLKQEAGKLVRV